MQKKKYLYKLKTLELMLMLVMQEFRSAKIN